MAKRRLIVLRFVDTTVSDPFETRKGKHIIVKVVEGKQFFSDFDIHDILQAIADFRGENGEGGDKCEVSEVIDAELKRMGYTIPNHHIETIEYNQNR